MTLVIAKKSVLDYHNRKRHDVEHSALKNSHSVYYNSQTTVVQLKPTCPCGGGCPLCSGMIQPKLTIGQPNDIYEQEADRSSMSIVKMPAINSQRSADSRRQSVDSDEHSQISEIMSNRCSGQRLDDNIRSFMEDKFGYNFSHVRLHTDLYAARKSNELNAEAFTIGRDVFFNADRYNPFSTDGKRLLAHELTHVVQQAQDVSPPDSLQRSDGGAEEEIDEREVEARQAEETLSEPAGQEISPTPIRSLRLLPLPETPDLRVTGIGLTRPTIYLRGPSGGLYDLSPYTGNRALDFPLAALEALGIPILSYFHFHYGRAASLRGMRFRNVYGLSGGTSFIRNAVFYGYIDAENVDLYGVPSSYSDHYDLLPNVGIHANPMDIGTIIHVDYFNNPLPERPNNPTIIFSLVAPFDQNPIEAFSNLGGAVYHALSGRLYSEPGVTHNYPEFWRLPEESIGR